MRDAPTAEWCAECQRFRIDCTHQSTTVADGGDITAEYSRVHRLVSEFTDERSAHEMLERLVDAGVDRDQLRIEERLVEVERGP